MHIVTAALLLTISAPPNAPSLSALAKPAGLITAAELGRRLVKVQGHTRQVRLTPKLAARIAAGALAAVQEPANRWLNVYMLLGLAINESDLWPGTAVGWDCGLTQIRVDQLVKTSKERRDLCWKLRTNVVLAFHHAARILTHIKTKWCVGWRIRKAGLPLGPVGKLRCLLGTYNAGPTYLTKKWQRCAYKSPGIKKLCKMKRHYWLRGLCFGRSVQLGRRPLIKGRRRSGRRYAYKPSCRRSYSLAWLNQVFRRKRTP